MARSYLRRNIAIGAAGLALTAGAVATGLLLGDKSNRRRMVKGAKKGLNTLATLTQSVQAPRRSLPQRDYAIAHQVRKAVQKGKRKASR